MKNLIIVVLVVFSTNSVLAKKKIINLDFETVAIPNNSTDELLHFDGYCTNDLGRERIGKLTCHLAVTKFNCSDVGFFRGVSTFSSYGELPEIRDINLSEDLKDIKFRIGSPQYQLKCEVLKMKDDRKPSLICKGFDHIKEKSLEIKGSQKSIVLKDWCDKDMTLRGLEYLK